MFFSRSHPSVGDRARAALADALAVLLVAALPACTGAIGASGSSSRPTTGTPGGAGSDGTGAGDGARTGAGAGAPVSCQQPQAATLDARLLSPSQYDNTVRDLLQVVGDPAKGFAGSGFAQLDDAAVEQRANAATAIAQQAAATLSAWSPCAPPAADATACEQQLIDRIGGRAFRRPLTADDRAQMKALFDAGIKEKDFATGVEWFLTGLLQAPDFLYLFAKPAPSERPGQVVPIEAHDMASRLAYFVWDSPPDDALLAAADAGQLSQADQIRAQVARLMADPRSLRGASSFYSSWLHLEGFSELARDDAGFTGDVVTALATSLLLTATNVYSSAAPSLGDLFSGQTYPMNATLRAFYGRPGMGDDFAPVVMDGEKRHGIITHPGLMARLSRPEASNPIARGLFILGTLLCQEVPAPPSGIMIPPLPPVMAGLSTRDRLSQHVSVALCKGCHDVIDPPGFALENFDQVGRFRTVDSGRPVDTSGKLLIGGDVAGDFADGEALLDKIATS
ncbi:MAG TPA: DUF1588 domain-containing protein, partial [Polyangia bacterium]|nr:DUF1588 domain-containing protein [Polyangia bacterium]